MKIYTKTGDSGETGLIGGARVRKDDPRVALYGDVDELNAALGLARSLLTPSGVSGLHDDFARLQADLFELGAELASDPAKKPAPRIGPKHAKLLEEAIDRMTAELPPLTRFILPGGTPSGAALHLARAICRRAERRAVALSKSSAVTADCLIYLNRLSDYLFTLARYANLIAKTPETAWESKK